MGNKIKIKSTPHPQGGVDLSVTCKVCGGPITHSNTYGMYCDKECGIEEDKKAYQTLKKTINTLLGNNNFMFM